MLLFINIIFQCIWPLGGTHKQEEISGKSNAIQLSEINLEKAKRKQQRQTSDNLDTSLTSEDEVLVEEGYVIGSCIKHIPIAGRNINSFIRTLLD